jgi:uncharacterized protein (TIGR02246 family)
MLSSKRFQTFSKILGISAWAFCQPLMAGELKGWQVEPLSKRAATSNPDVQQIDDVLLKRVERWNAHDIEGYLEGYWESPKLLVIVDSEQFNGWQQLHDSYINEYADRNAMGAIEPVRIQVRLLKPDLALVLTWWSRSFPSSERKINGKSTIDLQKFEDGWKIVACHTDTIGI